MWKVCDKVCDECSRRSQDNMQEQSYKHALTCSGDDLYRVLCGPYLDFLSVIIQRDCE